MNNLRSIPRIIHVQDRDINYYMENNNTQYKNKYKNTYSYKQNGKKNNDNYAYSQRLQGPDCVLLPLVNNLYIAFRISSSRRNANDRTSFSFELPLLQSSPVVEISSLLNFIHTSLAKLFSM